MWYHTNFTSSSQRAECFIFCNIQSLILSFFTQDGVEIVEILHTVRVSIHKYKHKWFQITFQSSKIWLRANTALTSWHTTPFLSRLHNVFITDCTCQCDLQILPCALYGNNNAMTMNSHCKEHDQLFNGSPTGITKVRNSESVSHSYSFHCCLQLPDKCKSALLFFFPYPFDCFMSNSCIWQVQNGRIPAVQNFPVLYNCKSWVVSFFWSLIRAW